MYKVVLLRHGESQWNKENRFTGWTDVDLTEKGEEEAKSAGILMKEAGFIFDIAFTSVLKRFSASCTAASISAAVPAWAVCAIASVRSAT